MKYFLDTEFLEGKQKEKFPFSLLRKESINTIDLISIGIVSEDGREYYAVSKDFNLKEAWNRYDIIKGDSTMVKSIGDSQYEVKNYWIRDNVLKPIMVELQVQYNKDTGKTLDGWKYKDFKFLINKYGKTNKQIAKEVKHFVANRPIEANKEQWILDYDTKDVSFYTYYGAYDWVVFCWLFGKMIDLPKGFPMFSRDLKVMLDDRVDSFANIQKIITDQVVKVRTFDDRLKVVKSMIDYPKQDNCHNALDDARWNKKLYEFINTL